ncbi:M56 family metallopeptidase [Edaphobacter sp. HDX4]|uniref:M56 family metallopeptidase n=1 Tax=Edaphobacter sp. HDX4 TaxID=2794064 RepID=UPI002FE6B847
MFEHLISTIVPLSAAASGSLINAIAQGTILAAVVALCLRLLPSIKPAARFAIWISVLFTIVALHLAPGIRYTFGPYHSSLPFHGASVRIDPRWSLPIAALWLLISFIRAFRLVGSAVELRRIAAAALPIKSALKFQHLLQAGLRSAELCSSTDVDRPSVVGFFHPRVLIPSGLLARLSSEELEQIILHEMEHLRRRDDWTNLLQKVALILFPLNPVLFWIEQRLCMERELACDDCVLHFTTSRKSYAACLTSLAEHSLIRRGVSLALGAWEKQSELSRRVHRILSRPQERMKRRTSNLITGSLMAALLGGGFLLAGTPRLVSFSPAAADVSPIETTAALDGKASHASTQRDGFSPTFVKAVMPEPQKQEVSHRRAAHHSPVPVKAIHRTARPRPQQWVVLTRWKANAAQPRPMLAISEIPESSYAAVSFGNGWLILQL